MSDLCIPITNKAYPIKRKLKVKVKLSKKWRDATAGKPAAALYVYLN
tara:strand:- start:843 stop:983 length:141 start_codon:yes stop_codon:yes gene_type:complete